MTRRRAVLSAISALSLAAMIAGAHAQARDGLPPPGASSCSGCHPISSAVDTPVVRLVGRNPAEIVSAVQAFRSGQKPATVMDRIAKGFSHDESVAIAAWWAAQK